jgi:hypothetical protein
VLEGDGALEHVVLRGAGVRPLDAEQRAQLDDEALRRGQLAGGHALPAGDEGAGVVVRVHGEKWRPRLSGVRQQLLVL